MKVWEECVLELRVAYPVPGSKIGRRREKGKRNTKQAGRKRGRAKASVKLKIGMPSIRLQSMPYYRNTVSSVPYSINFSLIRLSSKGVIYRYDYMRGDKLQYTQSLSKDITEATIHLTVLVDKQGFRMI